jgi:restriction system protein
MSRKNPSLLQTFAFFPWWVSLIAGFIVFITLSFIFPALAGENQLLIMVTLAAKNLAWLFACLFLIPAISSLFKRKKQKRLIEQQQGIETLKEITWSDFEILVGEAFRRKGYSVQENMVGGPDGGVDLTLSKDGALHIVQCKHWRSSKVGVPIVREMFGVLKATKALSVFIVTSGEFTKEAINFANDLPIQLVNGDELMALIADVQLQKPTQVLNVVQPENNCPKCSSPLVKRIAKRGTNAGNEFFGCSGFPKCRYIENKLQGM